MMPIRAGSRFHSWARLRTNRMARIAILACMLLDGVRRALLAAEPIFKGKCGHADAIQVTCRIHPFRIIDQHAVAATGTDHHGGTRCFFFGGQKNRDRRVVNVLDPIILGELWLVAPAFEAGRTVRPEGDDLGLIGENDGRR